MSIGKDGDRRLRLLNIWAYSRILTLIGEGVDLDAMLRVARRKADAHEAALLSFSLYSSRAGALQGNVIGSRETEVDNLHLDAVPETILGYLRCKPQFDVYLGDRKEALLGRGVHSVDRGGDDYALPANGA